MLLAVDVGNTQTHFGAFAGEQLLEHWRFATVRQSTADELGAALSSLLDLRGYGFDDIDASIVSSTVPQLEPEWTAMAERYLGHQMLAVGPGTKTGMAIRYDNPREIGADRLVNAVAIRERFGALAVCVDFGTATTFDVVSREGAELHLGAVGRGPPDGGLHRGWYSLAAVFPEGRSARQDGGPFRPDYRRCRSRRLRAGTLLSGRTGGRVDCR